MMSYAEKAKSGLKVINNKKGVEELERFEATFVGEEEEEEEEDEERRQQSAEEEKEEEEEVAALTETMRKEARVKEEVNN